MSDGGASLDAPGPLNIYEYAYLKGDKVFWPGWGAAFGSVAEWCRSNGYGGFGEPTESGKRQMSEYERSNPVDPQA